MASNKQIQQHFDKIVGYIAEDLGRTDLKAVCDEKGNWRLTCLDANGERNVFGGIGISATAEKFSDRLIGFWQGEIHYRNYIAEGLHKLHDQESKLLFPKLNVA